MTATIKSLHGDNGAEGGASTKLAPVTGRTLFALVGTGTFTVIHVAIAALCIVWAGTDLELGILTAPGNGLGWTILIFFGFIVAGVLYYLSLCVWMQAVRSRLVEVQYPAPPTWQIWLLWLIPLWNLVGPLKLMKALRAGVAPVNNTWLYVWWGTLVTGTLAGVLSFYIPQPDGWNVAIPALWAPLVITSYVALVKIVRETSASATQR